MSAQFPRLYPASSNRSHGPRYTARHGMKIGCTSLVEGVDLATAKPAPITCKLVPKAQQRAFMAHEGQARMLINQHPHPNLPGIVSTVDPSPGEDGFLVMPAFYGDMHSYVQSKGPLAEQDARPLFRQMAAAVQHCHGLGIMLRDLKLGKFLFANVARTRLVLADLDGATAVPLPNTTLTDAKGSPAYVAPEVLSCKPYKGAPADAWALGVILYVLLTGRYPFRDARPVEMFRKIRAAKVDLPQSLSPAATALISGLLTAAPGLRMTVDDVLDHAWTNAGNKRAAVALPVAPAVAPAVAPMASVASGSGDRKFASPKQVTREIVVAASDDHVVPQWDPPAMAAPDRPNRRRRAAATKRCAEEPLQGETARARVTAA